MRRLLHIAGRGAALAALAMPAAAFAQASPSAFTNGTRYDAARRVVGTISADPDGAGGLPYLAVRNSYDAAGRLVRVEKGNLAAWQAETVAPSAWSGFTAVGKVETSYDALDRKTLEIAWGWDAAASAWVAAGATQYSYDLAGRLECTAVRMNPAVYGALPASACTPGTPGGAGNDRITRNVYDDAGQLLTVQRAYGTPRQQDYAAYTYTLNGKVASMTDANGNKASMTWDGFDRQVQWNFPDKVTAGAVSSTDYEAYSYDANGNRLTLRKRDGRVIGYTYDALNRVTLKDIPGGTAADVYYGYDLRGLQLYARFVSGTGAGITNVYDGFGRLTSTTNDMSGTARTLSYEWDAGGNRTRITHPDSTGTDPRFFTYQYDGLDRPVAIKENGATTIVSDTYDAQGRRASETRGAVTTIYAYDAASRLSSLSDDLAGTASDVTTSFGYNPASQIVSKSRTNDLYAFGGYTTLSRSYTVNGLNQYGTGGPASFTYDANGNLTGDGTNSYTYDVENRMLTGSGPTATTMQYDPLGRLWRMLVGPLTIDLTYDGDAMVLWDFGTGAQRYVHGNGEDDPLIWYSGYSLANRYSIQADAQGSVVSYAYADGTPRFIDSYDEYGIPGPGNGGLFQYTGQLYLPWIGMYHYKARMYSPTLGRFMQTDPIGYADQVNLYAYVGNDPLDGRDPTGTKCNPEPCPIANDGPLKGQRVDTSKLSGEHSPHRDANVMAYGGYYTGTPEHPVWHSNASEAATKMASAAVLVLTGAEVVGPLVSGIRSLAALEGAAAVDSSVGVGEYAGDSIAARSASRNFTVAERTEINRIGSESGCHSCGTFEPGTKHGNFIPDHQPPSALNPLGEPQRLYPQCLACSRQQGLDIASILRRGGD